MYSRTSQTRTPAPPGMGGGGMPPRDVLAMLAFLFVTFSLQFFASTAVVPALLRLSLGAVLELRVWQLVTYAFTGTGSPSVWFLLELFFLYLFARDARRQLSTRAFWTLVLGSVFAAGALAVASELALGAFGLGAPSAFVLMQGQRMLLALFVAAFATLYRDATVNLFFVIPVPARFFIPIELLMAFVGYLGTHDAAGFIGIAAGIGTCRLLLTGGRGIGLREARLRLERWWLGRKLERNRRRSGLRVVKGPPRGGDSGPWVH